MAYRLGIDLGTTFTAAAVEERGQAEVVALGQHAPQIPSAVFVREDGELLVGDPALRRGAVQPDRLEREFKRRLGDQVPFVLGGQEFTAEQLTARLLRFVVTEVQQRQGGAPERIALTHPANWGEHRRGLLLGAVELAGVGPVTLLTEPAAAAVHFASTARADIGDVVAVYDFGGGTFDAAVLRKAPAEFELLGSPDGVEQLGGVDFDDLVFRHVLRALDGAADDLDPEDPTVVAALVRLRRECTEAKEALSTDAETTIPVALPGVSVPGVQLTRAEFEDMIRADVDRTVRSMRRALESASVTPEDVRTVVLVGGTARIPLVSEVLGSEFGRPVTVSTQPKLAVALGAALLAGGVMPSPPADAGPPAEPAPSPPPPGTGGGSRRARRPEPAAPRPDQSAATAGRSSRTARLAGALAGLVLVALLLAFALPKPELSELPTGLADGTEVRVTAFDVPVDATVQQGAVRLGGAEPFLEGPVRVELTGGGADRTVVVQPDASLGPVLKAAPLLLALFAVAYAESVLRLVRRRRRVRRADVGALGGVGAAAGLALVLASWTMAGHPVGMLRALTVVAACAAAGCVGALLQRHLLQRNADPSPARSARG